MRPVRLQTTYLVVLLAFAGGFVESARAFRLTPRELRYYGYIGSYRGFLEGTVATWNGVHYDEALIDGRSVETIAASSRKIVTAPTGQNGFFLTRVSANGNWRRATIRYVYSGTSFNPEYAENMYGRGQKTVSIVRRGYARPRLEMTTRDVFEERSVFDGSLFTFWRLFGSYRR